MKYLRAWRTSNDIFFKICLSFKMKLHNTSQAKSAKKSALSYNVVANVYGIVVALICLCLSTYDIKEKACKKQKHSIKFAIF